MAWEFEAEHLLDITQPVRPGMPVWPGDPQVEFARAASLTAGVAANVTRIGMGSHSGTHVDAPAHILAGGIPVDELPLSSLVGPCCVAALDGAAMVTSEDLEALRLPPGIRRLLLRTASPGEPPSAAALRRDAADWIVAHNLLAFGIDSPSVDPEQAGDLPAHHILLASGVVIIEALDLAAVDPGGYILACLPLRLQGCDGAPARALLMPLAQQDRWSSPQRADAGGVHR